jgi:hypothetical protein
MSTVIANMPNANEIIDMFADFQKGVGREIGELMGRMINASIPRGDCRQEAPAAPEPIDITGPLTALESRIMASIDSRLASLEARLKLVSGRKRSREPSPPDSEVDTDTDTEDNEATPAAPTKGQTTLTRFVQDAKAMADLVGAVKKLEMTEEAAPVAAPVVAPVVAPIAAPVVLPVPIKEEEETSQQSDEADEEEEEEEDDEEELTQITYKGKDYGMDGDGNIYGFDTDGDLIEEPIGKMDTKTNKISFF